MADVQDLPQPTVTLAPARGGWTLSGHIRRRLRAQPRMTRTDLRESLRQATLLTWGTRGGNRLRQVLFQMRRAGEIIVDGDEVVAVNLRQRVVKKKRVRRPRRRSPPKRLETPAAKRRRLWTQRQERAQARQAVARTAA